MVASTSETDAATPPRVGGISIPRYRLFLFQTIDKAQSSHGLSRQDYAQYHQHCTAKLYRLRHRRAVKGALVHSFKYVEGVTGKRHAYCHREDAAVTAEECWWNWVFQAERAWAQACELQHETTATSPSSMPSRHQRAVKRLKKAVLWADRLVQHATSTATTAVRAPHDNEQEDGTYEGASITAGSALLPPYEVANETILECRSYAAWMQGNLALEQKQYLSAFRSYHTSMRLLLDLAEGRFDSDDGTPQEDGTAPESLARRDVWTTRAESLLRPLVRFCGYEAQDSMDEEDARAWKQQVSGPKAALESGLDTASGGIVLSFRNKRVALDGYQEVAVLFLKVEEQLQSGVLDEDAFLKLTTHLDDVIRLIQTEYKHYESLPAGPAVQAKREELQTVRRYFEYQKLNVWRKQQEGRLSTTSEESDLLHVYDTLLKNAVAMAELQESQDRQDDPLWLEAQAHVLRFRAFRCYYLARYYEDDNQARQAAALFGQAHKLVQRAEEEVAACDGQESYLVDLERLSLRIRASICRTEAKEFLAQIGSHSVGSSHRPLWMRAKDWDDGYGSIADNPPLPIPIPPKPIFYDTAWQLVPRPDVVQDLADYLATHESRQGFFDWLRGKR